MNDIPPLPQYQPSIDASQFKPSVDSDSSSNGVGNGDFSSAMHVASSKPSRKSASARTPQGTQSGNPSPASGNPPPTALPSRASPAATASNAGTDGPAGTGVNVVAANTTPAPAPVAPALPAAVSQNAEPPAKGGVASPFAQMIDQETAGAPTPGAADASPAEGALPQPLATAEAAPAAAGAVPVALPAQPATAQPDAAQPVAAQPVAAQPVAAQPKLAVAAPSNATGPAARAGNSDVATSTASTAAATGTASAAATAASDTAAQTAMAAAAAMRVADGSNGDDTTAQNFLGAPDAAAKPADVAAAPVMPPVVGAAGGAHVAAAQAVAAATSNARAITALAGVSVDAADKPSHASGTDLSASPTSNDGSAGAAQLLTGANSPDTTPAPTFKISASVETSDFGQGVADRVSFMVDGNISSAKLQVNPPALGPIEVRIALQGAHAQVSFTSHSALTRDALESSAPKLRELLGAQGFGQVSVDVSQGSFQDRSAQSSPYQASAAGVRDTSVDAAQSPARTGPRITMGVLDAYA
jgi:flagellar hook-length control protein FliK